MPNPVSPIGQDTVESARQTVLRLPPSTAFLRDPGPWAVGGSDHCHIDTFRAAVDALIEAVRQETRSRCEADRLRWLAERIEELPDGIDLTGARDHGLVALPNVDGFPVSRAALRRLLVDGDT